MAVGSDDNSTKRISAFWYESKNTVSNNSSLIKNLESGAFDGKTAYPNIGAFRSSLQWRKDTAGGILTLAGNLTNIRNKEMINAQRLKYGNLQWDSEEAQAILGKKDNILNFSNTGDLTGIINTFTQDNGKLFEALLGGSGTGTTMGEELKPLLNFMTGMTKDAANAVQKRYEGIIDIVSSTVGAGKDLFSGNLDVLKKCIGLEPGDEVTWGSVLSAGYEKLKSVGSGLAEKISGVGGWLFDTFKYGLFVGPVLKFSNVIGGKVLGYCLRMTDVYSSNNGGATDMSILRSRVMNLPPAMTDVIDPNGRCYNNNVIACQHILSVIPGSLDYDGFKFFTEYGITNAAIAAELKAFENDNAGSIIFDSTSALASILDLSDRTGKRLGIFKPEVMKFSRVYMTAMGRLISRLSPSPALTMTIDKSIIETTGWGAFEIAIGTNTTLTESGSNSFTNSLFDDMMNGTSSKINEIRKTINSVTGFNGTKWDQNDSKLEAVLNGNKLNTPKFWESSDFSRSYTFNFRLESPYGDAESLMNYVYKPFLALLCCSLPIQVSTYGYKTPFVIRADCPGWFSIDCGYVSSLDFRRAPDEGCFSASGLPTAIEVTLSLTDIYPALALSIGPSGLTKNFGEQAFLDSLAGMDYKEIYSGGSMTANIRSRIIALRSMPGIIGNSLTAKASHTAWSAASILGTGVR